MPDVREKLVELLRKVPHLDVVKGYKGNNCTFEQGSDWLIAHGVTVRELDGCEYCEDGKSVYYHSSGIHDSMYEEVYVSGNNIVVDIGCHSYGTAEIKFCPICGRRLPQPPKGE